jgi:hypothetical protein
MKNHAVAALFLVALLVACQNPANNNDNDDTDPPENTTSVVFDNKDGICAVVVYDDHQRRETDRIVEIPKGASSAEIKWTPSNSYPFYFSYLITIFGISDVVVPYVPAMGKDQVAVRIDENKQTRVAVPALEKTLASQDELLSDDSYIVIQNVSSYTFQLLKGGSSLRPDNLPDSPVVNNGEKALYKITPGTASVYSLQSGANSVGLGSLGNFEAGYIYRLQFDVAVSLLDKTEIKLENILPPPVFEGTVPETPGLPVANAGDGLITISWPGVKDAEAYQVYLSASGTPSGAPHKTVSGHTTVTVITGLANKSAYTIWIKATNRYGASGYSPSVKCTPWPAMEPPQVPGGIAIMPGNGRLSIAWEAAAGASSYNVYISTSTTPPATPGRTTTETNAVIDGLVNGANYYIWVQAQNSNGSSEYSAIEAGQPRPSTTPPAVPGAPGLTPGNGSLTVKWQPVATAESYEVWAGTSANSADASQRGGDISGGTTQTVITDLVNETTYYVWVKAKNNVGTSGFSPVASAKPSVVALAPPVAPSTAPMASPGDGKLTLTWTAVEGATGYEVWKNSQDSLATATKHGEDITATSIDIDGLTNGTSYYFWIKAKNSAGTSEASPAASGAPEASVVGQTPASPVISLGDGELTIAWTALPGTAAAYEILMAETNNSASALKQGDAITGTLSKTISGLTNGTTYYLWVKARNFTGESNLSPVATGKPIATPGAPTLSPGSGQLSVTWTAAAGADTYEVYYGVGLANTLFDTVSGTGAAITGLTNGTTYQVRLRGKNETGVSGYGASASGMPQIISGLYKGASLLGAERIGNQNLSNSLAYIATNALAGDNYYILLGENESIPPQTLEYPEETIGITLVGIGEERQITLDGDGSLFSIYTGVTLAIDDKITLIGNTDNSDSLIKVFDGGFFVMNTGSKITGNSVQYSDGGGVQVSYGTFTMKGGEISGNSVSSYYHGGGVYVADGTFTMEGGTISGNMASSTSSYGGGVYVSDGTFTMEEGEISGNKSNLYGGGVYVADGTFTMKDGGISNNSASTYGGGVYVSRGTFTMEGGEISGNKESTNGGGVYVSDGEFTMEGGEISDHRTSSGGGVYLFSGKFTMKGGEISDNRANSANSYNGDGGGVYISSGTFALEGGKISDNSASSGGGVYISYGTFTMKSGEISNNSAPNGGGVYSSSQAATMEGGEISGNESMDKGGGVYVSRGTFAMKGGEISGNAAFSTRNASSYGGGVYVYTGTFKMEGGKISSNKTSSARPSVSYGGGVYVHGGEADVADGAFSKTDGIIYGNNASPVSVRNDAGKNGDAVYRANGSRKRNSTIDANEAFDSSQNTGWD